MIRTYRIASLCEAAAVMLALGWIVRRRGLHAAHSAVRTWSRIFRSRHRPMVSLLLRDMQLVPGVARRLPGRHLCLSQALTALTLLRRRRVPAELALGIRFHPVHSAEPSLALPEPDGALQGIQNTLATGFPHGQLLAHAWVELRGKVVFGGPVRGFTPLPDLPFSPSAIRGRSHRTLGKGPAP
jgi:hypothetical protein